MAKKLIYDVGMNNGDDSAYYLHKGYNVIAIEADPLLCEEEEKRFQKEIKEKRIIILNLGVAASDEELDFYICESNSVWSSFHKNIATRDNASFRKIKIPCKPFSYFLNTYGMPYYLKIDIEGNDGLCLEVLSKNKIPKFISIEGGKSLHNLEKLKALGYSKFKAISQFNFLPIQVPDSKEAIHFARYKWMLSNTLHARLIRKFLGDRKTHKFVNKTEFDADWNFPRGSSGPFGYELPGDWVEFEDMCKAHQYYLEKLNNQEWSLFWNEKNYSFWFDFHAMRDD